MDLEHLSKSDRLLFIDYSSLLSNQLEVFFKKIVPVLQSCEKKLLVPLFCFEELQRQHPSNYKILMDNKDSILKVNTKEVLLTSADAFKFICNKLIDKNSIIIITEDKSLADIINNAIYQKKNHIEFISLSYILSYKKYTKKQPHFIISNKLTLSRDSLIHINKLPECGEILYDEKNKAIMLTKTIKAGGEGTVYETNTSFVAKVYHENKLSAFKKDKILLLTESGISIPGVCFPISALYNTQNEFVGYLMNKASGHSLDGSFFKGERGVNRYFASWSRKDLVTLVSSILYTITKVHEEGLIIGDLNGANILVNSPTEYYFVDTDSYQINEYPCPVGTETFTAPEIQGKDYGTFLRTIDNENFAVATLVFKLLMFGIDPYAHLGGEGIGKNIKSGDFSFPFKEKSNKKIPDGDWKFYWSHLFFPLKQAFYYTFRKGECQYEPEDRPSAKTWLKLVNRYKTQLEDGSLREIDPESLKLFPKTYKRDPNQNYLKCKICKQEVIDKYITKGICGNCLKSSIIVRCKKCNQNIEYTNYKKYILQKPQPNFCKDCTKEYYRKKQVYETCVCDACGEEFDITVGEFEFFNSKGLCLPKRCKQCRAQGNYASNEDDDYDNSSSYYTTSSSSGGCYITTAACEYYGKSDDCYELTVLRHFRDEWLMQQSDGIALISKYYENAPNLVEFIRNSPDYGSICFEIMNKGVNPCIELINSGKYEECQSLYIEMVTYFYNKLIKQ